MRVYTVDLDVSRLTVCLDRLLHCLPTMRLQVSWVGLVSTESYSFIPVEAYFRVRALAVSLDSHVPGHRMSESQQGIM